MKEKEEKIQEYKAKEKSGPKGSKLGHKECAQCKVNDAARTELTLELSKAEKATLEARNEKMMALLEQKNIEERLNQRESEFSEREMQIKQQTLNELKVQKVYYE